MTGVFCGSRKDPRKKSSISSRTTSSVSASTRSDFVRTTIPRGIASSRQISKCSRVCGLLPSSAAITSSTISMPPTPASMLRTNRSCPGTSTKPSRSFSPESDNSSRLAKPRSIVIPRRFSSSSLSASTPVSALTKVVLP